MRPRCFLPRLTKKVFFPNWRKNWKEKMSPFNRQKCPCALAHGQFVQFHHFFFFFNFLFWLYVAFFFFFFSLFNCTWFFLLDFYFLINWVIVFFFLSLFCFNWPSFFNKGIWVNLYKLTFSIISLFYSQPNKNEKN